MRIRPLVASPAAYAAGAPRGHDRRLHLRSRSAPYADRGVIPNESGRVLSEDGSTAPAEYVVGWIKRGPSGVIGTNRKDAAETVSKVLEDAGAGRLRSPVHQYAGGLERCVRTRAPALVTWTGWCAIDDHETSPGARGGRPRVKLVDRAAMLAIAGAPAAART